MLFEYSSTLNDVFFLNLLQIPHKTMYYPML
jgi:hypothetical protein